jgi:NAD-dependent dihydropyrimidine dehydrogenase PreA subunit
LLDWGPIFGITLGFFFEVFMAEMLYLKNVVTLQLDPDKCTGCGTCLEVCPQGVLGINGKKAGIIHRDSCIECGACALNCPFEALTVEVGVGCAAAVINAALGRSGDSCCCVIEPKRTGSPEGPGAQKTTCC